MRGLIARAALVALLLTAMSSALAAVGRTVGLHSVGQTGDAQYRIPIWAPSGTGNLHPRLAIQYSSSSGDGLLGMGFQVSGFSRISRCEGTIAQDGAAAPVTLFFVDRMCLDGNRLRLVSGTDGATGAIVPPGVVYES